MGKCIIIFLLLASCKGVFEPEVQKENVVEPSKAPECVCEKDIKKLQKEVEEWVDIGK